MVNPTSPSDLLTAPLSYTHIEPVPHTSAHSTRKTPQPKETYEHLHVPPGTPVSRLVLKEVQELDRTPSPAAQVLLQQFPVQHIEDEVKQDVRIPVYPDRFHRNERPAVVEQPCPCPSAQGTSGPFAVRTKMKARFAFKAQKPVITKSGSFVPSNVLGDVDSYAAAKRGKGDGKTQQQTDDLVDVYAQDMRKVASLMSLRIEGKKYGPPIEEPGK
ncbi:hypothetical protein RvY_12488 [Ramazzottius varieornatus]|uniref:Uncharacterized protein n=1 Tax=Ramazzottius varieornatus TaxID=947166 RepID=A0A1D1VSA5_RAMVA|nr:hypothetical protein RvY_12488 [Ramazzottius varieornatus]